MSQLDPTTADAVDREAAWLTGSTDSLPALLAADGGPFQVIEAYLGRVTNSKATQLYVLRSAVTEDREAAIMTMDHYDFALRVIWPIQNGQGSAQADQRAMDAAIELLLQRIRGLPGDHSHGGRFRSVAENPRIIQVQHVPPESTMPDTGDFRALVKYRADEYEIAV